jgi:hypothetical protein
MSVTLVELHSRQFEDSSALPVTTCIDADQDEQIKKRITNMKDAPPT